MTTYHLGMVGLGVMGGNLARNFVSHGFSVAGYDLDQAFFCFEGRLIGLAK